MTQLPVVELAIGKGSSSLGQTKVIVLTSLYRTL